MGKSVEFRIPMPLSLDEYRIAQTYMKTKMQMENTSGTEGVEVVASQPFTNEELGTGHFSHVIYHMQSKAPAWVRALAPHGALMMEEMSWNAYPHSKTVLKCPYFSKFLITIKSVYLADRGDSENALNLSEEELAERTVDFIDIAVTEKTMFTRLIAKSGIDPATYKSQKWERGPLLPGWKDTFNPIMTAYKLVTVEAPYWGFGKRMEQMVLSGERALFLEAHKKCFGWMDEWCDLTIDDVRKIEKENIESMRKNLSLKNKVAPAEFDETKAVEVPADEASGEAEHRDAGEASGKEKQPEGAAAMTTAAVL